MIFTATLHETPPERRIGFDRREYSYSDHMPERRSGEDRRKNGSRPHPTDAKPPKGD